MKRFILLVSCLALLMGSASASVALRMDGAAALLREDGEEIVPQGVYEDIVPLGDGLFAASADGALYGLLDGDGRQLGEARYEEIRSSDGALTAQRDGGWGLLGSDGAELGAFDFDEIVPDGRGGCWALQEGEDSLAVFLLSADGAARDSGLRILRRGEPGEGLLPVETEEGRWGYCDAAGKLAIPARYEWAGRFASGCAAAVDGGLYGAIDKSGNWVVAAEWDYLDVAPGGLILLAGPQGAQVRLADGSALAEYPGEDAWIAPMGAGYIVGDEDSLRAFDASGNLIEDLPPDASVSEGLDGRLIVSEGMWGEACVRLSGTERRYQNLYPLGTAEGEPVYAAMSARSARYQSDLLGEVQVSVAMDSARYGIVDGEGEPLFPGGYLSIVCLADDRFLVEVESQYRMINSWGMIFWRSNDVTQTARPRP